MSNTQATMTVLGGTGAGGAPMLMELLDGGLPVCALARTPEQMRQRFPKLTIVAGSMLRLDDVRRAITGATTIVLLTPLGGNNNTSGEREAVRIAITAARAEGTAHIIYTSLISAGQRTGIAAMDVKSYVEQMLAESGVGWSSLRAGAYMEYFIGRGSRVWTHGLFPAFTQSRIHTHYTAQRDIARVAATLHTQPRILNAAVDVTDPTAYTRQHIVQYTRVLLQRRLHAFPGSAAAPLITASLPIVRRIAPKQATVLTVIRYLATHNFLGNTQHVTNVLPGFMVTTVEQYIQSLLHTGATHTH